ncbi:hypothetical protein BH10BAC3_BH10BAC3_16760 [soil metagenome]
MNNVVRIKKPSFFLIIAIVGLFAVLIGFARTFIIPVATNRFSAPILIHIHGAFAFTWILLFLTQTSLIHFNKYKIHQTLGFLGLFISAGIMITMIPAGVYVVQRDLRQGFGESSYSSLLGVITSGIMFFSLVLAGILKRRVPESHKRLMLLATIIVLWPAWFRFRHYFPSVPRPDIWFALVLAYSLIIIAWIWDKRKNESVHPILKYVGLFIILEQTFEVFAYDSSLWRQLAKWSYNLLSNIS